jgi:pimeloyl-ACP methyl ester carboxylesterase
VTHSTFNKLRASLMKGLAGLLAVLVILALAGSTYQTISSRMDEPAHPAPGQLVDAGGHRLHLNCTGQGRPTVVLESGLANRSADWDLVQPRIAAATRVCSYDRAGIGWSESGPEPRDPRHIAEELHMLLRAANLPAPYVLVGHSFGGLYVRMFTALYPEEVAGMVLVDSSHPDQWAYAPAEFRATAQPTPVLSLAYRGAQRLGVARAINMFPVPADCGHPAPYCADEKAYRDARFMDAYVAEMGAADRDAQVRATPDLENRPLVVLTASDHSDQGLPPGSVAQFERDWRWLQEDLAGLSNNSQHVLVGDSRHGTLQTTYAVDTAAAIVRVVDAARSGALLADTREAVIE